MNIVFIHVDTHPKITLKQINEYRTKGYVVFIVSDKSYSFVHSHYYQYGNGFLTDEGRYAQMGCCEVIVDKRNESNQEGNLVETSKKDICRFLKVNDNDSITIK